MAGNKFKTAYDLSNKLLQASDEIIFLYNDEIDRTEDRGLVKEVYKDGEEIDKIRRYIREIKNILSFVEGNWKYRKGKRDG